QQHHHARAGARGAPARVIDRAIAFGRLVDDDQELRLVPSLVAAALQAHEPPLGDYLGRRMCAPMLPWRRTRRQAAPLPEIAAGETIQRRTKPTISLTAFIVSAAMSSARAAPAASTESI